MIIQIFKILLERKKFLSGFALAAYLYFIYSSNNCSCNRTWNWYFYREVSLYFKDSFISSKFSVYYSIYCPAGISNSFFRNRKQDSNYCTYYICNASNGTKYVYRACKCFSSYIRSFKGNGKYKVADSFQNKVPSGVSSYFFRIQEYGYYDDCTSWNSFLHRSRGTGSSNLSRNYNKQSNHDYGRKSAYCSAGNIL